MPAGEFASAGYYERQPDGSQRLNAQGNPIFHPEWSKHHLAWPAGPDNSLISQASYFSLATGWGTAQGHVWFIGTVNGKPQYINDFDITLSTDVRFEQQLPANTDQISVRFLSSSDNPVAWTIEVQTK